MPADVSLKYVFAHPGAGSDRDGFLLCSPEMTARFLVFLVLAGALSLASPAQDTPRLTAPERAMVAWIDANQKASNQLLAKLVNINSGTHNLEGVRAVGQVLMPELRDLGFKVQWLSMDEVKRAGVLVADHPCPEPGKCGKRMLLIGHMDTV